MGVLNYLMVADFADAEAIASSSDPPQKWDGFFCHGLDRIPLATLWALVDSGLADDGLEQRLDAIKTITKGDQGPWVDIVPRMMLTSLASIAAMEEDERESLARRWGQTEEMAEWDSSDVISTIRIIGDYADSAHLANKSILIWTSL